MNTGALKLLSLELTRTIARMDYMSMYLTDVVIRWTVVFKLGLFGG